MTRPPYSRARDRVPDQTFVCVHCGQIVAAAATGTRHRNHCPRCLWSRHVDVVTGDRRSGCKGEMEPIAVWVRGDGEWAVVHRCRDCSVIRTNRIAGDDNGLVLVSMATRPLARPPFPLDQLTISDSGPANED